MKNKFIALDTNIFVYHFQKHPKFGIPAENIFKEIISNKRQAITSVISLIELLSIPIAEEEINRLQAVFLETPNLTIYTVDRNISNIAAKMRRSYRFRLPDAIQLSTAIYAKADVFITNDKKLLACKEIKVQILE